LGREGAIGRFRRVAGCRRVKGGEGVDRCIVGESIGALLARVLPPCGGWQGVGHGWDSERFLGGCYYRLSEGGRVDGGRCRRVPIGRIP
jgi:hypothetical protein